MPAIQEVVSAMVCGHEQAASTTNGAARVHEGKHHRGHGPLLPQVPAISVGTGMMARPMPQNIAKTPDFPVGAGHAREHAENA